MWFCKLDMLSYQMEHKINSPQIVRFHLSRFPDYIFSQIESEVYFMFWCDTLL